MLVGESDGDGGETDICIAFNVVGDGSGGTAGARVGGGSGSGVSVMVRRPEMEGRRQSDCTEDRVCVVGAVDALHVEAMLFLR